MPFGGTYSLKAQATRYWNNFPLQFIGISVTALLSQNLNLANHGSRDHCAATPAIDDGYPEVDRGAMFEYGN